MHLMLVLIHTRAKPHATLDSQSLWSSQVTLPSFPSPCGSFTSGLHAALSEARLEMTRMVYIYKYPVYENLKTSHMICSFAVYQFVTVVNHLLTFWIWFACIIFFVETENWCFALQNQNRSMRLCFESFREKCHVCLVRCSSGVRRKEGNTSALHPLYPFSFLAFFNFFMRTSWESVDLSRICLCRKLLTLKSLTFLGSCCICAHRELGFAQLHYSTESALRQHCRKELHCGRLDSQFGQIHSYLFPIVSNL